MKLRIILAAVMVALSSPVLAACPVSSVQGSPVLPPSNTVVEVCHDGYEAFYDVELKAPKVVVEFVSRETANGDEARGNWFKDDPLLPPSQKGSFQDYVGAFLKDRAGKPILDAKGKPLMLARGHLAPYEDFSKSVNLGHDSFLRANFGLQVQACNNAGVWTQIEEIVRDWGIHYGGIHVATGLIFNNDPIRYGSGTALPDAFYKVVMIPALNQSVAFVVTNVQHCKQKPREFVVSQDAVEKMVGIKFFPNLSGYTRGTAMFQ